MSVVVATLVAYLLLEERQMESGRRGGHLSPVAQATTVKLVNAATFCTCIGLADRTGEFIGAARETQGLACDQRHRRVRLDDMGGVHSIGHGEGDSPIGRLRPGRRWRPLRSSPWCATARWFRARLPRMCRHYSCNLPVTEAVG